MNERTLTDRTNDLRIRLAEPPEPGSFSEADLEGLPELVRRFLRGSISPGTPLARAARFHMRGHVRLGKRWVPFRAREVLAPHRGFVWSGGAGGVISGSDRYGDGKGAMDWKVLGLVRVAHADGPDVSRSSVGRAGGEAVWVPTTLLPRFGVGWGASDDHHATATFRLGEVVMELHLTLDDDARIRAVAFERWGDPDDSGTWGNHPFGFDVTRYSTFDGVSIPSAGHAGWFFGSDRWDEGRFFKAEIHDYHLVN